MTPRRAILTKGVRDLLRTIRETLQNCFGEHKARFQALKVAQLKSGKSKQQMRDLQTSQAHILIDVVVVNVKEAECFKSHDKAL